LWLKSKEKVAARRGLRSWYVQNLKNLPGNLRVGTKLIRHGLKHR